jgi:hypothetical protein
MQPHDPAPLTPEDQIRGPDTPTDLPHGCANPASRPAHVCGIETASRR